jgi:hypothetical protein
MRVNVALVDDSLVVLIDPPPPSVVLAVIQRRLATVINPTVAEALQILDEITESIADPTP